MPRFRFGAPDLTGKAMAVEALLSAALEAGKRDGEAAVVDVLNEQGRDVVIATLRPGHLAWDEAAINAGAHRLAGVTEEYRQTYYAAYEEAARTKAEQIRDET